MVNSTSASILNDPVSVIASAFQDAVLDDRPSATDDFGIPGLFEDTFQEQSELDKVPSLIHVAREERSRCGGRLFRAHCYVTHSDSEIYGGAFRLENRWRLGRYGMDALETSANAEEPSDIVFEERTSLQCRLLDLSPRSTLEGAMSEVSLSQADTIDDRNITVKLYNEKEEGLLHASLDVVGLLEVAGTELILHSLITTNQRLSSFVSAAGRTEEQERSPVRADLLQTMEAALSGDSLAAELTLLGLCSSVAIRTPMLVGPLTVNLRGVSPEVATTFSSFIKDVAANSLIFDMSIDNLNKAKLYPSHDGEDFSAGSLQLPADSTVLLNESALSEGKLDERGVKNLQCLSNTITSQDLIFHFPFSEFKIPMDLSFVTVSHGKSLLPSTVSIPLKSSSIWNLTTTSSKTDMRRYLAHCRLQETEISDALSSEIQEDFVSRRKQGRDPMDQNDLGMTLALGKEICRSHARRQMSWDDYLHGQKLYGLIKARNQ